MLPTAAIEQHSRHLPVSTDSVIGDELVRRLDAAAADAGEDLLVLPTLWLRCSRHHRDHPGTLTTTPDHFSASLFDAADSVFHAGFTKLFVLNAHGGNAAILHVTLEKLQYAHPGCVAVGASYWDVAGAAMAGVRESGPGGVAHACEMETSVMLALWPDLVDVGRAAAGGVQPASPLTRVDMLGLGNGPGRLIRHRPFTEPTNHGGIGDPTSATARKGERFLDAITGSSHAAVQDLRAGRVSPGLGRGPSPRPGGTAAQRLRPRHGRRSRPSGGVVSPAGAVRA